MNSSRGHQNGFTVIELMIATVIFSVVLLLCTTGILQVTKLYFKGVTESRTQEVSRNIIDDISRSIQYNGGRIKPQTISPGPPPAGYFCIGSKRYSYVLDRKVAEILGSPDLADERNHVFVVDTNALCSATFWMNSPANLASTERELMGPNMRLSKLSVVNTPAGSSLWKITVRVVSGRGTDIDPTTKDKCDGKPNNMFCAVSELSTTVQKRIQ